jgi:hypothetical protein
MSVMSSISEISRFYIIHSDINLLGTHSDAGTAPDARLEAQATSRTYKLLYFFWLMPSRQTGLPSRPNDFLGEMSGLAASSGQVFIPKAKPKLIQAVWRRCKPFWQAKTPLSPILRSDPACFLPPPGAYGSFLETLGGSKSHHLRFFFLD